MNLMKINEITLRIFCLVPELTDYWINGFNVCGYPIKIKETINVDGAARILSDLEDFLFRHSQCA